MNNTYIPDYELSYEEEMAHREHVRNRWCSDDEYLVWLNSLSDDDRYQPDVC